MRTQVMFLAALFALPAGFQTADAQTPAPRHAQPEQQQPLKYFAAGVGGTIKVAVPLNTYLSDLTCSDIEVRIENQKPTPAGRGINLPAYDLIVSRKAQGDISKGKCGYAIANLVGLPVKKASIFLTTSKHVAQCAWIDVDAGSQEVVYPSLKQMTYIDFVVKPTCIRIN